jgi:alkyl sulfatase BDS1-like metallo-beta-lactamase superfamily hydrolase
MANLNATLNTGSVALTAATAKTIIMLTAPTNQCLTIKGIRISFDGATSTAAPATVELGRPSSAGTFTSTTPRKRDTGRGETVQATGGTNASAEPTWTSVIDITEAVPVYGGNKETMIPINNPIIVPGGTRFAMRVTAAAGVNAFASFDYEE